MPQIMSPIRPAEPRDLKLITHAALTFLMELGDLHGDDGSRAATLFRAFSQLRAASNLGQSLNAGACPGLLDLLDEAACTCWGAEQRELVGVRAAVRGGLVCPRLSAQAWGSVTRALARMTLRDSLRREALLSPDPLGALLGLGDRAGESHEYRQLLREWEALSALAAAAGDLRAWFDPANRPARQLSDLGLARLHLTSVPVAGEVAGILARAYPALTGCAGDVDGRGVVSQAESALLALREELLAAAGVHYRQWLL